MQLSDFDYHLPPELIAQYPLPNRSGSRLLHVKQDHELEDLQFTDLPPLLQKNDLLIFNDTKVIPARLFGKKASGGVIELLVERITGSQTALAQIRASKSPKPGSVLQIGDGVNSFQITILEKNPDNPFYSVEFNKPCTEALSTHGQLPLPPYISHQADKNDQERYQTIWAKNPGAVAAPTAGLHFDHALMQAIESRGVQTCSLTLHVGAGTFMPVRVDDINQHQMHSEWFCIPPSTLEMIHATKQTGGRIIAVGTTSLRALESWAILNQTEGETRLFIKPGFQFKIVDALVTNFHLPCSTLLMLVSAFAGQKTIRAAYAHAITERYRFFSYGDAMLLHRS